MEKTKSSAEDLLKSCETFLEIQNEVGGINLLQMIFVLQDKLNERHNISACDALSKDSNGQTAGRLVNIFIDCMHSELEEMRNCLFWKHWYTEYKAGNDFAIHDLHNLRVEVIDVFHFLITLAMLAGFDANSLMRGYLEKYKLNLHRVDTNTTQLGRTEEENNKLDV